MRMFYCGRAIPHAALRCAALCAEDGLRFFVEYDKLAIATGSQVLTAPAC